ncbi:tyrosine-type recombinase/integrase [Streptomyces xantholiticus]|uniref:tyrosine-type recombinase/integrase n=1 Tax=Streptomyces xantholiticus TaxID=68285 RepID=UPI00167A9284|nr:tyrosine-type recombinase/integrase [Streptomyces xantholiticus]GGW41035.1 putative prophage phiRv2 integrase [Streptomyces xantholiticus]
MARKGPSTNPRQLRSKLCGCPLCLETFPPSKGYRERKPVRDCSGAWQARYRDPSGKQCGPTFPTKKEAETHLDKARSQVREGTYQDPKRGQITVSEWYAIWWPTIKVKSVTTRNRKLSAWRVHVEPKWGARKLNSVTWMQVQDWITNEVKGHATQKKALELLRHMMVAALRDGRITVNPCLDIEVSSAPARHPDDLIPPTHAQCDLIREQLTDYYRPLVTFLEETGMRWGEATGLRACNVSLEAATVKVKEVLIDDEGHTRRKPAPKSRAGFRTVPLTPVAVAAVRVMFDRWAPSLAESPIDGDEMHPEELVFRGPQGGVLTRPNFRRHWVPAIKDAGLARMVVSPETGRKEWWPRVHDLRHTFATRLKDAGVPEKDVQVIMGHERGGRVTWLYQHAGPELVDEVRAALVKGTTLRAVS